MLRNDRIRVRTDSSRGWRIAYACTTIGSVVALLLVTLNPAPQAKAEPKQPALTASTPATVAETAPQMVSITGTCRDEKHKPLAGVHIRLFRIDHSDKYILIPHGRMKLVQTLFPDNEANQEQPLSYSQGGGDPDRQRLWHEARTDAQGRFQFADLEADEGWRSQADKVWIVAQAAGKGTEFYPPSISRGSDGKPRVEPLKLTLQESASLRGRITNTDGRPVAGAMVSSCAFNYLAKPLPGILCAVTDADGRYDISDLSPFDVEDIAPSVTEFGAIGMASIVFTVEHADYAPGIIEYTKVPASIDHVLQRPATLRGQVLLDDNDQPAENTRVRWTHENGLSDAAPDTGADGNYSISRLVPGKYTIAAHRDDRLITSQEIQLVSGDNRLDLRLKRGGFIKGRVVDDATGNVPRFNRSMSIEVQAFIEGRDPLESCKGWVNDDGSFSMTVEPGRNSITFFNPNWQLIDAERWYKKGIDVAQGQTTEIELRVTPRVGGWASVVAEAGAAEAAAKGEPAPPAPPAPPEQELNFGDENDETAGDYFAMVNKFVDWPNELLPKKPMSERAVRAMLDALAEVERKTIDGEECITSIQIGDCEPSFDNQITGQIVWLEYSVLANIDTFPHLESLWMLGVPGDDKWLEPLRGHTKLQSLMISMSKNLTTVSVQHLATLPNLTTLGINGFKLGDDSLGEINRMPALEILQFGGIVTDAGIAHLRGNTKLKTLSVIALKESNISDESLRHAAAVPNLEQLAFFAMGGKTLFTDDGLKHLASLTKLQNLAISGNRITDAGLFHLHGLKNLKELTIQDTSVTQQGLDELKEHRPELKVTGNQDAEPVP